MATIPSPNPIPNSANVTFSYIIDPSLGTTGNGNSNSNIIYSKVNAAILNNISKSTDKSFADIGSVLTYTVAMTNSGNTTANNVIFKDTIPNGTSIVAGSLTVNGLPISGSPNPPGVNIGTIPAGSTYTVSFKVLVYTIPSPNPISNSASTSFSYIVDPTLGTTSNANSNSNIVTSKINNANLSTFTKTTDKSFADVGSTITFTASIMNTGNTNANNVMFIDTIPNGTTLVTGSLTLNGSSIGGNPNPPGVNIGSILAGATSTVSFKVLVYTIPSPNPINNTASTSFNYIVDPTLGTTGTGTSSSNNTTSQVNHANLSNIFKTTDKSFANIGSTITYTVSINNSGSTTANNVMFIDTIPNGTSIVAGSLTLNGGAIVGNPNPPGVNIGAIGVGSTSTVSFKVIVNTIPSPNPISNSANTTFSYVVDPTLGTTSTGSSNSNITTNQVNNANLGNITKTVSKNYADIGSIITFTVGLKNSGSTAANNVMFIDTIPNGTSIVSGSLTLNGSPISGSPNPPGVNIGSISPNSTSTVSFNVLVYTIPSPNPISNSASTTFDYIVDPTLGTTATGSSNSNNTTSQINNANLSNMTKTTDKSFANVGSNITYTITIKNTGSTTANNIMFIDTIPNGTSIVSGSLTLNGSPIAGSPNPPGVNIGSIGSGTTATVSFKVVVNTIPVPNPISNSASTNFNYTIDPILGITGTGSSNSNSATTQINNTNLSNILKTVSNSFADVGTTLTFNVTMQNSGSTTANNVMFIDTIPNGTSIVLGSLTLNGSPIAGNPNPPGVNIGSISPGATSSVSFKVLVYTIPSPNPISNSANVTFSYIVDPSLGTTATGSTNSNFSTSQINNANLKNITKSVSSNFADVGSTLTFTVNVKNTGSTTANNVMFIDTVPNGTSIVLGSLTLNGIPIIGNPNPPGANIGSISPGATSTISFKVLVYTIPSPNPIINSASTTFNYIVDPTLGTIGFGGSSSNTTSSKINNANLSNITKTVSDDYADIGSIITYSVGIKNTGSANANNVMFIDTIPNGTSIVSGSLTLNGLPISGNPNPPGLSIGTIFAGTTSTVSFKVLVYTVPSPNPIANSASTTFNYIVDPTLGTTATGGSNSNTTTSQINNANLSNISKIVNKNFADIGSIITYTVSIPNKGSTTANNVVFKDTIPNGTAFVNGSLNLNGLPIAGSPNPPGVGIGSISPGSTSNVSFQVVVTSIPSPNPIPNSANVSFDYTVNPSPVSTFSIQSSQNASGSVNSNIVTTKVNIANLGNTTKTVSSNFADIGSTITYTIAMKNTGTTDAKDVIFIDTIPSGTSIIPGSFTVNGLPVLGNPNPPGANIGAIAANSTSTVSFKIVVNTIPSPNPISNSASTTFNYIVDPTLGTTGTGGSNSNVATSQINHANLSNIIKTTDKNYADLGSTITYTIAIQNTGSTAANGVLFNDTIPSGLSLIPGSFTVNGLPVSGNPTPPGVHIGAISAGGTSTVSFKVRVNAIPSQNPILNSANTTFSYIIDPSIGSVGYGSSNSNITSSQINHANISYMKKTVSGKFADVRSIITYDVIMQNTGSTTANNVIFIDTIPKGTSIVDGSLTVNGATIVGDPNPPGVNIGDLPANSPAVVSFQLLINTIPSPNPISNSANVKYNYVIDPVLGLTNNGSTNSNFVSTFISNANLIRTLKSVNAVTVVVGDVFSYTVTITNTGNTIANSIIFQDTIPAGTAFIDGSLKLNGVAQNGSPNPPGINIGTIAPHSTSTISFSVVVNEIHAPSIITNNASTKYTYVIDPTLGINGYDGSNSNPVTLPFIPLDYSVVGTFDKEIVKPCEKLNYTLTITNTEETPIQNLIVNIMEQGADYDRMGVTINGRLFKNLNPNSPNSLLAYYPELFPLQYGDSIAISYNATSMKSCNLQSIEFKASVTAYYNIYNRNVIISKDSNIATAKFLAMWTDINFSDVILIDDHEDEIKNILNSKLSVELIGYKVVKTPVCSSPNSEGLKITGREIIVLGVLKSKILYNSLTSDEVCNIYNEKPFAISVIADKNINVSKNLSATLYINDEELILANPKYIYQYVQISVLIK